MKNKFSQFSVKAILVLSLALAFAGCCYDGGDDSSNPVAPSSSGSDGNPGDDRGACTVYPPPDEIFYYDISGVLFYDIDADGVQDTDEPGLPGLAVTLNSASVVYTDQNGHYIFENKLPGNYAVAASTPDGFFNTTPASVNIVITNADVIVNFGFDIDYDYIDGGIADGYTVGYWKTNIYKAIHGITNGVQVCADTLQAYLNEISVFALSPFSFTSLQLAYNVLSATGSNPIVLLEKQLLASEFNYMSGAYINGNELLTGMFIYYGEFVDVHSTSYTTAEILLAKDWYDAYNNSHNGPIVGP
jgi:hypothetical protein